MICKSCLVDKELDLFPVRNDNSGRLRPYCYSCRNTIGRSRYIAYKRESPFKHRCMRAKRRSLSLNVPFNLTPEYLESIFTSVCPVFGFTIDLYAERGAPNSVELDRFIPELGYVIDNVAFLSSRANRLKNDASLVELQQLTQWMEKHENSTK